ncbi:MAG: hypothetical protein WAS49_12020 [Candidatus Dechloromonas phosphoritropha]|nr:hypothetical protein [Candidatus Dechloromonas phosphoritropha]MBP8786468.1 hypothetical protein [Azonexus sp.]MBP9227062.1 hypothetical protein [Azonexus sp.]
MFEEDGYIANSSVISPQGTVSAPAAALPSITAFGEPPVSPDPVRLRRARNFMRNTLKTFVGSLGTSSLLERIENADGHTGLRGLYNKWYQAITTSRDGRRDAVGLRAKLLLTI